MRLKEDNSSWRSRGIMRRDYRHDRSTPEVHKGHPKRKQKKPRVRINHKHVWVEDTDPWYPAWWPLRVKYEEDSRPRRYFAFTCSVPGCKKRKHVQNMRYGYEHHKWAKGR